MEADAWSLEQALWTGGVETYERTLAPRALTVVPAERGLLDRAATMDAIRSAPRWSRVEMLERRDMRPRADIIVLAYRAEPFPGVTGEIPLSSAMDDAGEVFLTRFENGKWNFYSREDLGIPRGKVVEQLRRDREVTSVK